LIAMVLLASCQANQSGLYDEVSQMAGFDKIGKPELIQYGKEEGFFKPIMTYGIFKVDSHDFEKLLSSIMKNEKFKAGSYYLNIELDDYMRKNNLDILNISRSEITQNKYTNTYRIYLLSDRQTFVICKINH